MSTLSCVAYHGISSGSYPAHRNIFPTIIEQGFDAYFRDALNISGQALKDQLALLANAYGNVTVEQTWDAIWWTPWGQTIGEDYLEFDQFTRCRRAGFSNACQIRDIINAVRTYQGLSGGRVWFYLGFPQYDTTSGVDLATWVYRSVEPILAIVDQDRRNAPNDPATVGVMIDVAGVKDEKDICWEVALLLRRRGVPVGIEVPPYEACWRSLADAENPGLVYTGPGTWNAAAGAGVLDIPSTMPLAYIANDNSENTFEMATRISTYGVKCGFGLVTNGSTHYADPWLNDVCAALDAM